MATATILLDDGNRYGIAHDFGGGRVVICYDGLFVFVKPNGPNAWTFDGEPVREDEKAIFNALEATVETTTTVTAPDGTRTTY